MKTEINFLKIQLIDRITFKDEVEITHNVKTIGSITRIHGNDIGNLDSNGQFVITDDEYFNEKANVYVKSALLIINTDGSMHEFKLDEGFLSKITKELNDIISIYLMSNQSLTSGFLNIYSLIERINVELKHSFQKNV